MRFILDIDHEDVLFEKVTDIAVSVVGVFLKNNSLEKLFQ